MIWRLKTILTIIGEIRHSQRQAFFSPFQLCTMPAAFFSHGYFSRTSYLVGRLFFEVVTAQKRNTFDSTKLVGGFCLDVSTLSLKKTC